jgi:hypothetical protein
MFWPALFSTQLIIILIQLIVKKNLKFHWDHIGKYKFKFPRLISLSWLIWCSWNAVKSYLFPKKNNLKKNMPLLQEVRIVERSHLKKEIILNIEDLAITFLTQFILSILITRLRTWRVEKERLVFLWTVQDMLKPPFIV